MNFKKGELKDGDVVIINNKEYKFITLRNRSKLVSKDGELLNPYRNQKVGIHSNHDGYLCSGGEVPVHLYVAYAWVDGYEKNKEVNHKDFNRQNNNYTNLEWVTHIENIQKSIDGNYEVICNSKRGVNNGRATFTEEEVLNIRRLYDVEKYNVSDIIKVYYPNATYEQIRNAWGRFDCIVKRKTWKHI